MPVNQDESSIEKANKLVSYFGEHLLDIPGITLGDNNDRSFGDFGFHYSSKTEILSARVLITTFYLNIAYTPEMSLGIYRIIKALNDPRIGGRFRRDGAYFVFDEKKEMIFLVKDFPVSSISPPEFNKKMELLLDLGAVWTLGWYAWVANITHGHKFIPIEFVTQQNQEDVEERTEQLSGRSRADALVAAYARYCGIFHTGLDSKDKCEFAEFDIRYDSEQNYLHIGAFIAKAPYPSINDNDKIVNALNNGKIGAFFEKDGGNFVIDEEKKAIFLFKTIQVKNTMPLAFRFTLDELRNLSAAWRLRWFDQVVDILQGEQHLPESPLHWDKKRNLTKEEERQKARFLISNFARTLGVEDIVLDCYGSWNYKEYHIQYYHFAKALLCRILIAKEGDISFKGTKTPHDAIWILNDIKIGSMFERGGGEFVFDEEKQAYFLSKTVSVASANRELLNADLNDLKKLAGIWRERWLDRISRIVENKEPPPKKFVVWKS